MAAPDPIIPPNPIEANVDYRYDGCYQSMVLVLLQRVVDESSDTDLIAKLQEIIDELTELNGKVATETTLEAARVLLASLDSKDFATQTTLALVEAITSQMTFTGGDLNVNASVSLPAGLATEAKQDNQITLSTAANALLTSLDGKDYASETTLELIRVLLVALESKDYSTETTLAAIKAQTDLLNFTGAKLRTTGEDGSGGGGGGLPVVLFGTTTPLAASATFSSGILSLEQKSQVETTVSSDTDGTLVFDFYNDLGGSDLVRSLSIPYVGGSGFQYFAAPAFSNFVEYKFINSATLQTDFLYQTKVLTTALSGQIVRLDGELASGMVAPITRSILTGQADTGEFDNVRITQSKELAIALFDSQTGSRQIVDLNGAAKTGEAFVLVGDAFYGQVLNSLHWDTALTGSGSETPLPGTHRIATGTTANSKFCLQTVRPARFMIAQFNIAHFGIQLNTADLTDVNCIRRFGVFDPISTGAENGLFFEVTSLDGVNPQWYCVSIKDGVETQRTAQANFNGSSAALFNPMATVSAYEIQYNAGTAFFFQGSNFIHQVKGVPVYSGTYNFNVGFSIENINGNTSDNLLDFRAGGVYRLGEPKGDPIGRAFTANTVVKNGTGYISHASLSRTGSSGGNGTLEVFDGIDNTGFLIGRIDVGGDDLKGINIGGTFTTGLYVQITGSGTNTANLTFE